MPVDVEVDNAVTLLFVVLNPVDRLASRLTAVLSPVEVEVDSAVTLLFVVLNPVESEFTPLCAVLMPVDVEVDNEARPLAAVLRPVDVELDKLEILLAVVLMPVLNCDTVTASCGAEPSATLVIRRNAVELPTDTSESGAAAPVR